MKTIQNNQQNSKKKLVYVLNANGTPLMPCVPVIVRLLLKENKARVVQRTPFTLRLRDRPVTEYVHPLTIGGDTESVIMETGVTDEAGTVYYASELALRQDIPGKMTRRRKYRRAK